MTARAGLVAAVLVALAAFLRLVSLDADPPLRLDDAFFSDEGWWAHNARNHYLFGRWIRDDFNQGALLTPLHTGLLRASFGAFGLGLAQARAVSAAAGIATVVLVGGLLARSGAIPTALCAMALLAIDPFAVAHGRVALVEALPPALMLAAAWLAAPVAGPAWRPLAAGAVAASAVFAKINALVLLPALLLAVAVHARLRGGALLRRCGLLAAGMVAGALPWLLGWLLPHLGEWRSEMAWASAANAVALDARILVHPFGIGVSQTADGGYRLARFLAQSPLAVPLALVWIVHASAEAARRGPAEALRGLCYAEILAAVWLAAGLGSFWLSNTFPERRYLVLLVPCAILGAHALAWPPRSSQPLFGAPRARAGLRLRLALGVALGCAFATYLRPAIAAALEPLSRGVALGDEPGLSRSALCAVATTLLVVAGVAAAPSLVRLGERLRLSVRAVALALAVAGLVPTLGWLASDFAQRRHGLREAADVLGAELGADARVAGGAVETLLLGTRYPLLILRDRRAMGFGVTGWGLLDAFRPTHLLFDRAVAPDAIEAATRERLDGWGRAVAGSAMVVPVGGDGRGEPRFTLTLVAVEPARAGGS